MEERKRRDMVSYKVYVEVGVIYEPTVPPDLTGR